MNTQDVTFGQLLRHLRPLKGISLRGFAKDLDITPAYLSDVEKGNRKPFSIEFIDKTSAILKLTPSEKETLLDLAGKEHNSIAPDVIQYVSSNAQFTAAFRKAQAMNVTEEEWMEMLRDLEERRKKNV